MYLFRAIDNRGQTIDFLLSAKRDTATAKRLFRKASMQPHTISQQTAGLSGVRLWQPLDARQTLAGYETIARIGKGQAPNIDDRDSTAQTRFIANLFDVAA
jgi:transposase, IS6 family